ncbi:MAG: ASKHA domain-containing protein [Gammaproteobacteria bacterium]
MPKIVFTPSGIRGEVSEGTDVLSAARNLGVDLASVCGGNGLCKRCKIRVEDGEFAKHQIKSSPANLTAVNAAETEQLADVALKLNYRLGCQARIHGDVVIDVPQESQSHEQVVRKAAADLEMETGPAIELVTAEVEEADMHNPSGDLERLMDALEFEAGLTKLSIEPTVLRELQPALRKGKWTVTVAIHERSAIVAIWPGAERGAAIGLAVDIGSTTIAGHLCELDSGKVLASHGIMNPQIRYGEDLMSRVSYSMMNPGGDRAMTQAVREGINQLIDRLLDEAGVERERVLDSVFVCNPVMHHLFLGLDPVELGGAPFALATQRGFNTSAASLDLRLAPGARAYLLPCIAGHVGADAAAITLSQAPYSLEDISLTIDVGTNAEIVLGNNRRLVAASSPTGPAFEGAQINNGQRAAVGAIERVRIDPETLEPRYKVIGIEPWSDEAGFAEQAETVGISGICGSGIIEAIACMYLAGIINTDGLINPAKAAQSSRIEANGKTSAYRLCSSVLITQNDVRAIQLAKATLYASVRLLMDHFGTDRIDHIYFAGAFGSHIDPLYAMALGMIPDCPLENVQSVGNAAGTGARIALSSVAARREIENEVVKMLKIETAVEPSFQDYFVAAMAIPHKTDSFENLAQVLTLPAASADASALPALRRRRRSSRGGRPN